MEYRYDISPEEFELLEQFLDGQMNAEEAAAFNEKLKSDTLLSQKLNEVKLLRMGIAESVLKDRMKSYHDQQALQTGSATTGRVISLGKRLLAAASVLAIVSLSAWWFFGRESKYEELYGAYYSPDEGLITSMGVADNYTFQKAMVDYRHGEYQKAIDAWKNLLDSNPGSDTLQYFLGAAYQANKETANAIALLEKSVASPQSPFYRETCWYLGLAYLQKGDKTKAIDFIKKSAHPKSKELLTALDKE